jgi:hypothetical protein
MNVFRDSISLMSRYRPQAQVNNVTSSPKRFTSSRVLAALDAEVEATDIDRLGSFDSIYPGASISKTKAKAVDRTTAQQTSLGTSQSWVFAVFLISVSENYCSFMSPSLQNPVMPLPVGSTANVARARSFNPGPSSNRTTAKRPISTVSNSDAPTADNNLPVYSYEDFSPAPISVYTRHEDEANELVETLKG